MRSKYLSLFSAFLSIAFVGRVGASCYYPDGTFPTDYIYTPCTGDTYSSCCIASEGDQCLSNGLCEYPGGDYVFRGACTDKTWEAPECFQHCKTGDSSDTYDTLVSCGGTKYCCNSEGSTCCNDDSKVFDVGIASVINDLASSTSAELIATQTDEPVATQTDAGAGQPTTSSHALSHSVTKSSHSASTGTAAAATNTSTSIPQPAHTSHVAIYAAIAAGVVILVVAILLVWFFLRRHYRKKAGATTANSISYPLTNAGFERLPDKSPRPVEVPAPHTPAPPYQPPVYQSQYQQPTVQGAMELDSPYNPPRNNGYGKPVYEAP
ncbi:uncharacterized protein BDZ99DRAFT_570749 [Mytilinidion resinicola]|uniref:Mid2 domain-containing protein n=1 Tax=Mytilinidion resinicola TaxID=574789 RepID=A0A6A6YQG7_9PEZI|nr:uncharacterized protein BDZ99DRAFT_570749 [Mytilinidion resinicola]KAF2810127.1 hypothetical protein BDZ99DRAFT_570749 [Mytilinidion resinicola]